MNEKDNKKECGESSVYDYLEFKDLKSGIVKINCTIISSTTPHILAQIREIKRLKLKECNVLVMSAGGDIYSSFAVYDALKELSKSGINVKILAEGICASAAAMIILQAGNERLSRPSTRFLLHEISRWGGGVEKQSVLKDEIEEINILSEMIINILSKRCHRTKREIKKLFERKDVWMSADESKKWGLIDGII